MHGVRIMKYMKWYMSLISIIGLLFGVCSYVSYVSAQASSNYKLRGYEFGGGGGVGSSTHYGIEGVVGEPDQQITGTNYNLGAGLMFIQQAHVPDTPTITNPSNWYNKLKLTVATSNNPSDTLYAIAISPDNFSTTYYIQSDNTVGPSLGIEDYQTYTAWGGASGFTIVGLTSNTTYTVKVKAMQGNYTESGWGPTASAATSNVTLDFDIDVSTSDQETASPYSITMGELNLGSVTTAAQKVWVDLDTNSNFGAYIYVYDSYGGLRSTANNYTISSSSTNLTSVSQGFGLQGSTVAETSGGPLALSSPYNGASENVGAVTTSFSELFHTNTAPVVGGRGSFVIKAKASSTTPSANDYSDTLTLIAASTF